jgi:putative spermidine/putrescine transport system substrate-binding protein
MKKNYILKSVLVPMLAMFFVLTSIIKVPASEKLVVMTWGGHWGDTFRKTLAKPFENQFGVTVETEVQQGVQAGLARILAQKNNPQVDVVTTSEPCALVMREQGAIYKFPRGSIPNIENLAPGKNYLAEDWVAYSNTINGIFYRADMIPFEIKTWKDLFDPRLKNLVTVPSVPFASGRFLVTLALINGGSEKNIDPAFEAARRLRPNIAMFFKSDAESIKYIQSGEAAVCSYGLLPNVYKYIGKGSIYKFVIPPQYIIMNLNQMVITNPKNMELATKFINFAISFEANIAYNNELGSFPSVKNAKLPNNLIEQGVSKIDLKNLYFPDEEIISKSIRDWAERWEREIVAR